MSLEILAFRIIGKTFGSALRETSVVIAVFLAAMSLGYYLGGRIGDRLPRLSTLAFALVLAGLATLAVPALDDAVSAPVFASRLPLKLHSSLVAVCLFAVPVLLLASVPSIAIRLLSREVGHSGRTAGGISAISTAGSIAGSLLTAFVLIDTFGSVHRTVYALAGVVLVLACLTSAAERVSRLVLLGLATLGAAALAVLCAGWRATPLASFPAGSASGPRVVFETDSPFHHIQVRDEDGLRTLSFDQVPQSRMRLDDPLEGGLVYTLLFHVPVVIRPRTQRVLFVGLGGGTGPKRFVHDYPWVTVDAVDVDPVVVDVAKYLFAVKPGPRLNLQVEDGRAYLKRSPGGYDLIAIDVYTHNRYGGSIPPHLVTREFFQECASRLTPTGMLFFNLIADHEDLARALSKTLGEVFPSQLVFRPGNTVFVAAKGPLPGTKQELLELTLARARDGVITVPGLDRQVQHLLAPLDTSGVPVLTDDSASVDRLLRGN